MREPDTTIDVWRVQEQKTDTISAWTTMAPGLVIHERLDGSHAYVVTHQRSGLMVAVTPCGCFRTSNDLAVELGEFGDWDRPGSDIRADMDMGPRVSKFLHGIGASAAAPTPEGSHALIRDEALER